MKKVISLLYCFFLTISAFAQRNIDVLHYKFNIELNDNNDTIFGRAEITVKFTQLASSAEFDLFQSKDGKGMQVSKVDGTGIKGFVKGKDGFQIHFTPTAKDSVKTFTVFYQGIPANGLIISKNKYGKRTFFGDNWPNRAHHWLPCIDDPSDKASVEFLVTAPVHYQVVANGVLMEETNVPGGKKLTHWKEEVPLPTKVMVIGVAEFAVQHTGIVNNCIPVSSWVFPENKKEGFYDYEIAQEVLAWHINYIGPYAYKKLANVQSKTMFGGMENASAIFYYEGSVTGNRTIHDLISHEIVHQWFGNHATEKSFAHLWLSEGFATYLTHVYIESIYGTDSLNKRMADDRVTVLDFVKNMKRPVVDSTADYMKLLSPNSYQKGSWVLHMLRRQLGDSVFHKSIRDYYAQFGGKNAETKDLQKIFETNSGKKLDTFFEQWLHRPVNPKLDISWKYSPGFKNIEVTITQLQDGAPFVFPLELELNLGKARPKFQTIYISKKTETFTLNQGAGLLFIKADPNTSLLMEAAVKSN